MEDLDESCGLLPRILRELFERIDGSQEYAVGISCWEMLCNESVDLLKPFHRAQKTDESPSSSFGVSSSMSNFASPGLLVEQSPLPHLPGSGLACIEVRSMEDARAALNHSRAHSANWYVDSKSESFCTLPNRAHAFVRVMLYSKVQRRVSCINVVDLVGSQSLAARGGGASSSTCSMMMKTTVAAREGGTKSRERRGRKHRHPRRASTRRRSDILNHVFSNREYVLTLAACCGVIVPSLHAASPCRGSRTLPRSSNTARRS